MKAAVFHKIGDITVDNVPDWIAKRLYLTREEEQQSYTKLQFLKAQLIEQTAEIGEH